MKRFLLYGHGGAYNHGAEAIVKCTSMQLKKQIENCEIILSTHFLNQDMQFGMPVDSYCVRNEEYVALDKASEIKGLYDDQIYAQTISKIMPEHICLSVGGDNYCYNNWQRWNAIHNRILECGARDILWSCSIEPNMMSDLMIEHLSTFDLITARESITYDALQTHGLKNVVRCADVAFLLKEKKVEFPDNFIEKNTVAINISPLVLRRELKRGVLIDNLEQSIQYVLDETNMNILFIPHVTMPMDNDMEPLLELYEKYYCISKYSNRVSIAKADLSAAELKYLIARCRFGIFARTHASIAAYSSIVPCIVLGYSIKSAGIAKDLGMQDYVIPIYEINDKVELVSLFRQLIKEEFNLKSMLIECQDIVHNQVFEGFQQLQKLL